MVWAARNLPSPLRERVARKGRVRGFGRIRSAATPHPVATRPPSPSRRRGTFSVILGLDPRTQRSTRRAERGPFLGPPVKPDDDSGKGRRMTVDGPANPNHVTSMNLWQRLLFSGCLGFLR